ncbi:hypothetical protein [Caryophanon latum]|uniref:DUF5067 domain-containing protein n=1 Tax=Caryophanon latum TaxID=33977 RepID=A0A1C0YTD4_9BACL|nr:hypothetical protein [Caryophanon latum]OCS90411.1 hypothetical protein A6K76_11135 [Caryophanon latum]
MRKRWLSVAALAAVMLSACSEEEVEQEEIEILPADEYIAEFKQSEGYETYIGENTVHFIQPVDFTKDEIPELVTGYNTEIEGQAYTYVSVFSRAETEEEVRWNLSTEMYSDEPNYTYNNYGTFAQEEYASLWVGGYTQGVGDNAKQVLQVYDLMGGKLAPLESIEGVATEPVSFDQKKQTLTYKGGVTYEVTYVDGELIVKQK